MITKASQISILVKDLEVAKKIYVEKLGFSVCAEQVFSSGWRYLTIAQQKDNTTVFVLVKVEKPEQEKLIGNQSGGQISSCLNQTISKTNAKE